MIFHILGTILGLQANDNSLAGVVVEPEMEQRIEILVQTLVKPFMMTVLLSIMLIYSDSMMVNDNYNLCQMITLLFPNLHDPIVSEEVPLIFVKQLYLISRQHPWFAQHLFQEYQLD